MSAWLWFTAPDSLDVSRTLLDDIGAKNLFLWLWGLRVSGGSRLQDFHVFSEGFHAFRVFRGLQGVRIFVCFRCCFVVSRVTRPLLL